MAIHLKNTEEIEKMRRAGKLAASVLEMITPYVVAGVSTDELNDRCHNYIVHDLDAIPSSLNYLGFPKSICASVNHVICHGIPGPKVLKDGDIVNLDVTVKKDDFNGDTSKMFFIGEPSVLARRLVNITRECLIKGIQQVKPGAHVGDIGAAIYAHATQHRFSVVREYCGHGVGKNLHEDPQILHYGVAGTGLVLEPGMTFTIEPMINAGKRDTTLLPDKWTVITKDRSLSAQWEHTLLVTETGCEILTLRAEETDLIDLRRIG